MRVVLFEMGRGQKQRVLVLAHHLVVDGVSWRIVLEDLERGYGQVKRGEEVELGKKTSSFRQWAEQVKRYAGSEELKQEVEYWAEGVSGDGESGDGDEDGKEKEAGESESESESESRGRGES